MYRMLQESKIEALNYLRNHQNFIHNEHHVESVGENAETLANMHGLNEDELIILRLSAHWHDTGRKDYEEEKVPHEILSNQNFRSWAEKVNIPSNIIEKVSKVILCHRASNNVTPMSTTEKIFFDADKLDILNIKRAKEIINQFEKNCFSSQYNFVNTLTFWNQIQESFESKLLTNEGKILFRQSYEPFRNFVMKQLETLRNHRKKIIGYGGTCTTTKTFLQQDTALINLLGIQKICYLPFGLFNKPQMLCGLDAYTAQLKAYYREISSEIECSYVTPEDTQDMILSKIHNADSLYIGGGDTQFLISYLITHGLDKVIIDRYRDGKTILGNSAGLLCLCENTVSFEKGYPNIMKGIPVLKNTSFVVHYQENLESMIDNLAYPFKPQQIKRLNENEMTVIVDERIQEICIP